MSISRIPAIQFSFELWRAGSLIELGIKQREWCIKLHRNYIRDLAVGFAEAERLAVRPKRNCIAVMFFVNNKHFWTHLTNKEFIICFPESEKYLRNIKN